MNTLEKWRAARERLADLMDGSAPGRWTVHQGAEWFEVRGADARQVSTYMDGYDAELIVSLRAAAPVLLAILDDAIGRVDTFPIDTESWVPRTGEFKRVLALADAILGTEK